MSSKTSSKESPKKSPKTTRKAKSPAKAKRSVRSPKVYSPTNTGVRAKAGQRAREQIQFYQNAKNAGRVQVPRAVVDRIVRELAKVDRVSEKAVDVVHNVVEDFIVNLFEKAKAIAGTAGRITVQADDIALVRKFGESGFCKFF